MHDTERLGNQKAMNASLEYEQKLNEEFARAQKVVPPAGVLQIARGGVIVGVREDLGELRSVAPGHSK
jgi:hypothetical protein